MRDIDAVRHLFQVSAGLDSQMLGENQILSQVKEAYSISTHYKMSRFVFHRLFHNAFRVGKMVRSSTDINCGAVSISLAAVELAKKELDLKHCCAVMVGAGENAELAAKYLCKAGLGKLRVVNRNIENAQVLCESLNTGTTAPLEELYDEIAAADLVICSTAAQEFVVSYDKLKNQLDSRDRPLVIIDIAVPRDVEPEVGDIGCVKLYNIDDLDERICINRQKRANEVPKANEIVDEYTDKFFKWYRNKYDIKTNLLKLWDLPTVIIHGVTKSAEIGYTKQMLIGYMIEYLIQKDAINEWSDISNKLTDTINDMYYDLEQKIEGVE